jgi:tRNA modification GTPase
VVIPIHCERYEIHCHGGKAAIARIMADLTDCGVQSRPPRASSGVPHGHIATDDRLILEACDVLSTCTTGKTAAIALDQVRGALKGWRDDSIHSISNASGKPADQSIRMAREVAREAAKIAAAGRLGVRLARPYEIVLAGPPNVGKSSLINAIVGYDRSITMDLPGTTRDVLDAETVFQGWPLRLRDTAGLHSSDHSIERQGIQRALAAVESADLVVQVSQPGVHLADDEAFARVIEKLDHDVPVLQVLNKSDLKPIDTPSVDATSIETIATTGDGIPELLGAIAGEIQAHLPAPGSPVPINPRQKDWLDRIAALADDPPAMLDVLKET